MAFLLTAGTPEAVQMIDCGDADAIDLLMARFYWEVAQQKLPPDVEQQLYNALPATAVPVEFNGTTSNATSAELSVPNARALGIVPDISDPSSVLLGQGDAADPRPPVNAVQPPPVVGVHPDGNREARLGGTYHADRAGPGPQAPGDTVLGQVAAAHHDGMPAGQDTGLDEVDGCRAGEDPGAAVAGDAELAGGGRP